MKPRSNIKPNQPVFAALPPDVRKGAAFLSSVFFLWGCAPLACVFFLCLTCCLTLFAATTRADYQTRVQAAAQLVQTAATDQTAQSADTLARLAGLLPVSEDIADGAQLIRVNNTWLHEQIAQLPVAAPDEDEGDEEDEEARAAQWQQLAVYLAALNTRVNDLGAPLPTNFKLERAKLDDILARSEYKTDERQASGVQLWLKQAWERFLKWLRSLVTNKTPDPAMPGQGTVSVARVIIIALLAVALAFALFKLLQWWQRRLPKDKETSAREILGVEINEETTTEDLLAAARALAQQGDARGAIRRAYIALLYELEQRGKLRLHRAKTNRDYLQALRHETALYPSFAALTLRFEQVWYGQTRATQFDFEGFLNGYVEVVKSEK